VHAVLHKFLQHVVYGEQEQAESMLKLDPSLLLQKGQVIDYSNRAFTNITAFQYSLWALDRHMWEMLLKYFPTTEEAAKQLAELESTGTEYQTNISTESKVEIIREKHFDFSPLINALKINSQSRTEEHWCKVVGGAHVMYLLTLQMNIVAPYGQITKLRQILKMKN
jgi:hypothetical protein